MRTWFCTKIIFHVLAGLLALWVIPAVADEHSDPDPPPHAVLNEQVIRVPGSDAPPPVTLQVTLMHPDGPGPFPLAIMNHGATGASFGHRGGRYRLTNAAFYFLSRGYAVALPMMRGFSTSGGDLYHAGCELAPVALDYARDIQAVIRYLGNDPRFDTRRVIVAGQSLGGWNTLGVGALNLPNVVGLVNFNGGLEVSDCKSDENALISGAGTLGAATKIPSIWFYGDNDTLFPVSVWRAMYDRYRHSGGHAQLVDVGTVMENSHNFLAYPEVLPLWTAPLDRFLASLGMPSTDVNPGDLPVPFPAATGFAAVTDVAAVPNLNDKGRDAYRAFLQEPSPRVFALTGAGGYASTQGGYDPIGRLGDLCRSKAMRCVIYAADDRVVWKPLPSGPQERSFSLTLKADQPTLVNFAVRLNQDCSKKTLANVRLVQPPAHGQVVIVERTDNPHFPDNSPMAVCNKMSVPGIAVSYAPTPHYTGDDVFTFAEDVPNSPDRVFKIAVTVK
jgi:dienelactone hydrolase